MERQDAEGKKMEGGEGGGEGKGKRDAGGRAKGQGEGRERGALDSYCRNGWWHNLV